MVSARNICCLYYKHITIIIWESSWMMPVLSMFSRSIIDDFRSIVDGHKWCSKFRCHSLLTQEASFTTVIFLPSRQAQCDARFHNVLHFIQKSIRGTVLVFLIQIVDNLCKNFEAYSQLKSFFVIRGQCYKTFFHGVWMGQIS